VTGTPMGLAALPFESKPPRSSSRAGLPLLLRIIVSPDRKSVQPDGLSPCRRSQHVHITPCDFRYSAVDCPVRRQRLRTPHTAPWANGDKSSRGNANGMPAYGSFHVKPNHRTLSSQRLRRAPIFSQ
jgi:hypothetical protein